MEVAHFWNMLHVWLHTRLKSKTHLSSCPLKYFFTKKKERKQVFRNQWFDMPHYPTYLHTWRSHLILFTWNISHLPNIFHITYQIILSCFFGILDHITRSLPHAASYQCVHICECNFFIFCSKKITSCKSCNVEFSQECSTHK